MDVSTSVTLHLVQSRRVKPFPCSWSNGRIPSSHAFRLPCARSEFGDSLSAIFLHLGIGSVVYLVLLPQVGIVCVQRFLSSSLLLIISGVSLFNRPPGQYTQGNMTNLITQLAEKMGGLTAQPQSKFYIGAEALQKPAVHHQSFKHLWETKWKKPVRHRDVMWTAAAARLTVVG